MSKGGEVVERKCVLALPHNNRLRLLYVKVSADGFNFYSLDWEEKAVGGWNTIVTLSSDDFQGMHAYRRWVSDIYSLDPQRGWAAIKVGEGDRPIAALSGNFSYSWRTWDLRNNREIGILKRCDCPFDPLD